MVDSNNSTENSLNIYQRINAVMAEMPAIEPDKMHPVFNKEKKKVGEFPYYSHDGVTRVVQPLFTKHGIVVRPTVTDRKESGNRVELDVVVEFINMDTPDDRMLVRAVGYGCDGFDKGPGKAMSYALKVAYQKVLMLNSGDDTGEDAVEHDPKDNRAAIDESKKNLETAANNYRAALNGAKDLEELRALKKDNETWLTEAPKATQDYFIKAFKDRAKALTPESEVITAYENPTKS